MEEKELGGVQNVPETPAAEPVVEPVTESVVEPVVEPVTEQVEESIVSDSISEAMSEPVSQSEVEQILEDQVNPIEEIAADAEIDAQAMVEEAEQQAEQLAEEADQKAEKMIEDANKEAEQLVEEANKEAEETVKIAKEEAEEKLEAEKEEKTEEAKEKTEEAKEKAEEVKKEQKKEIDELNAKSEEARILKQKADYDKKMKEREKALQDMNIAYEAIRMAKARDAIESTINYYKEQLSKCKEGEKEEIAQKIDVLKGTQKKMESAMGGMKKGSQLDAVELRRLIKEADKEFYNASLKNYSPDFDVDEEARAEMENREQELDSSTEAPKKKKKPGYYYMNQNQKNGNKDRGQVETSEVMGQDEYSQDEYDEDLTMEQMEENAKYVLANDALDYLINLETTAERKEFFNGMDNRLKLIFFENIANGPKEQTMVRAKKIKFIPTSITDKIGPKVEVEPYAEINKHALKTHVQSHLLAAKAQSDLVLKDLAKNLGEEIEEDPKMYGVDNKYKLNEVVDKKSLGEKVNFKTAFKRGVKYVSREAWRSAVGSYKLTETLHVDRVKPEFKNLPADQLTDEHKQVGIYTCDYKPGEYDKEKAKEVLKNDPYAKVYSKYEAKQKQLQSENPPKDLEGDELKFVNMYGKYRDNLSAAKDMQDIYEIYNERHPETPTFSLKAARDNFRANSGIAALPAKTYGETVRENLRDEIYGKAATETEKEEPEERQENSFRDTLRSQVVGHEDVEKEQQVEAQVEEVQAPVEAEEKAQENSSLRDTLRSQVVGHEDVEKEQQVQAQSPVEVEIEAEDIVKEENEVEVEIETADEKPSLRDTLRSQVVGHEDIENEQVVAEAAVTLDEQVQEENEIEVEIETVDEKPSFRDSLSGQVLAEEEKVQNQMQREENNIPEEIEKHKDMSER